MKRLLIFSWILITLVRISIAQSSAIKSFLSKESTLVNLPSEYNYQVWSIAEKMAQQTSFGSRVNINNGFKEGYINIFVVDSLVTNVFPNLECQCAVLNDLPAIVCDKKLLKHFDNRFDFSNEEIGHNVGQMTNASMKFFLKQWVIGHEVGHIFSRTDHNEKEPGDIYEFHKEEQSADQFVIQAVEDESDHFWMWMGFNNLISTTYDNTLSSWFSEDELAKSKPLIVKFRKGSHPPWLLRYINMSEMIIDQTSVVDNTGYFSFLRHRLVITESQDEFVDHILCNPEYEASQDKQIPDMKTLAEENAGYDWHYRYGTQHFKMSNFKAAFNEFMIAKLTMDTTSAIVDFEYRLNVKLWIAKLQLLDNNFLDAKNMLRSIGKSPSIDSLNSYNILYGLSHLGLEEIDSASSYFGNALALDSTFDQGLLGASLCAYKNGQYTEAMTYSQKLFIARSTSQDLQYLKYRHLWPPKLVKEVETMRHSNVAFTKVLPLEKFPSLISFRLKMTDIFYKNDYYDDALDGIEEVFAFVQSNPEILPQENVAAILNFEGMLHNAKGNFDLAIAKYWQALKVRTKDTSSNGNFYVGQTYYNMGNIYYKKKNDLDSASFFYSLALEHYQSAGFDISLTNLFESFKCYVNFGLLQMELDSTQNFISTRNSLFEKLLYLAETDREIEKSIVNIANQDMNNIVNFVNEHNLNDSKLSIGKYYIQFLREFIRLHTTSSYLESTVEYFSEYWILLLTDKNLRLEARGNEFIRLVNTGESEILKAQHIGKGISLFQQIIPKTDSLDLVIANLSYKLVGYQEDDNDRIDLIQSAIDIKLKILQKGDSKDLKGSLSEMYGNLSWYYLLTQQFRKALKYSKMGLDIKPENEWINTNLALSYLFTGKTTKALEIYEKYKNKSFDYKQTYRSVFLDDIKSLEERQIFHRKFYKIVSLITDQEIK